MTCSTTVTTASSRRLALISDRHCSLEPQSRTHQRDCGSGPTVTCSMALTAVLSRRLVFTPRPSLRPGAAVPHSSATVTAVLSRSPVHTSEIAGRGSQCRTRDRDRRCQDLNRAPGDPALRDDRTTTKNAPRLPTFRQGALRSALEPLVKTRECQENQAHKKKAAHPLGRSLPLQACSVAQNTAAR